MKKYILTETQIKSVVDSLMTEQNHEYNKKYIMNIQRFLNSKFITDLDVDGKMDVGSKTENGIMKYQKSIGVQPDGVWDEITINKMPKLDRNFWNRLLKTKFHEFR